MSTVPPVSDHDGEGVAAQEESAGRASERESGVAYRNASREARWVLGTWGVGAAWVVGFSSLYGYEKPVGEIQTILGMPAWIFWGVALPWGLMTLFITWFSLWFIADDPMGPQDDLEEGAAEKDGGEKGSGGS